MCESLVWDRHIIGKSSIKAGLNWVEGLFAWPLTGDQRAGDPALTALQRQAITCLSALCINPSAAGILPLKERQRQGRDAPIHPPESLLCAPGAAGYGMQPPRMLMGTSPQYPLNISPDIASSTFQPSPWFPARSHIAG